ncbi:hypothetical protein [Roseibium algae]|uniref:Uncharacterized protein n=1 Tax=Roseibium algae TaxID=3123038 RepID=A0ABU8TRS1_9HYPH
MNWKAEIQLRDLDPDQMIEFICRSCSHVHHRKASELQARADLMFHWMTEIERDETCRKRGCRGQCRMALYHECEASGFVGGLA